MIDRTNVYNSRRTTNNRGGNYYGGDTYYDRNPGHYHGGDYYEGDTYYGNGSGYYSGGTYYEGETHTSTTRRRRTSHSGSVSTRVENRHEVRGGSTIADPYVTLGIGMAGLNAGEAGTSSATGADFNLGLGVKGWIASGEFGVHYGAYDPESTDNDISLYGSSIDIRLQPRISFFEPYALIGAGLHGLSDSATDDASVGASLRLGLGADLRIGDDFGVSARYLHSRYAFDDPNFVTTDGGFSATNNQFGVNLLMYF